MSFPPSPNTQLASARVVLVVLLTVLLASTGLVANAQEEPDLPRFDFGTPSSPVADGWIGIDEANRHDAEVGHGIVVVDGNTPISRYRTDGPPDEVNNDFVLATEWRFLVDIANGDYDVTVVSGDEIAGGGTSTTTITLEGVEVGSLSARQAVDVGTFRTTVADGELTIDIQGAGAGGYINGILLAPAEDEPGEPGSDLPAPTSVRMAHVTSDAVTLRWDEVDGATGYVVSRSDAPDGTFTEIARTGQRTVFHTDVGIDTTTLHYYRAQAIDGAGQLSVSSATGVSSLSSPDPAFPDGGVLTLDFGPGESPATATSIDASTAYSVDQRIGFVDTSQVAGTDRGTGDALRGDFVTVDDTELVIDIPNGDYTVDVIAGDLDGPTDIAMTVEQMAKVQRNELAAGDLLEMSFEIAVVDGQLNVEFAGDPANLNALVVTQQSPESPGALPTAWVTGDSTVQTYTDDFAPQAGWGQYLDRFLSDDVEVTNKAIGGRSSKNFISQGRLDEVLLDINPGDYLFVQFGHNDNSYGVDDRYAAPGDYLNYLRTYVNGARQRGATPILVTPVVRRVFNEDGSVPVSFPDYVDAAEQLAAETGTPLVDLSASSRDYVEEIGEELSKSVFLWVQPGVYPNRPSGTQDDTHFQDYGAIQMARLVATDVAGLDIPLADEVVEVEPPDEVPLAPAGVVASNTSNSSVQLNWTEVDTADIYKVEIREITDTAGEWSLAATSTVTQALVTGLVEGTTYELRVIATNGRGDSEPSEVVEVTTKAPLYKFDLQLSASNPVQDGYTGVHTATVYDADQGFGWLQALASNAGRDRGAVDGDPISDLYRDFLLPGTGSTFVVDVPNGSYAAKVYYGDVIGTARLGVTVEGVNYGSQNAGRGSLASRVLQPVEVTDGQMEFVANGWWNGLEITPLQLAPTNLRLEDLSIDGADVAVTLGWDGTEDASGYRVYRLSAGAAVPEAVADVDAGTTTWVDDRADVGLDYTYTVVALDGRGTESVPSNALEVTTIDPSVNPPATPTGLAVTDVDKNLVALSWDEVDDALFYQVYKAEPRDDGELSLVARTTDSTWADPDVLTTVAYTYAIAAVNAGGPSALSERVDSPAVTELSRQAERIDRSPVAVHTADGVYIGWRLLGDDAHEAGFHVYRDGARITEAPITDTTNLLDPGGTTSSSYRVSMVDTSDVEVWATDAFGVWDEQTLDIPIDKPDDDYTKDGQLYSYRANDASIGDVDGDGEYEIVLKWDPSNARDNSQAGYTGIVYLDAYELDGTRLWRIDMGPNIRAGAHYTQFQVFDLDGDGRAEVTMKTADGTVDGAGTVIGDARADYRNSSGYVLTGPEYLTLFDGATGVAIDTVDYLPPRGDVSSWGDGYGNRVDRFLAGTAYLDGEQPSVIFSRGYYTRTVLAAWDFDGADLVQRWVFDSDDWGSEYEGQGNHQLSVADVDGDQKDEVVFGSMTIDDDGAPLYNTGLLHGDALHVSDFDLDNPGQEVFMPHEVPGGNGNIIASFRDAATGETLWSTSGNEDTGRGAAADIDPRTPGSEAWHIGDGGAWNSPDGYLYSADGDLITNEIPAANFVTWWDGDLLREITDHDYDADLGAGVPTVAKWDWEAAEAVEVYRATGTLTSNSTKGNPALQADLFGDWREELVTRTDDSTALRIHTTVDLTDVRLRTLHSDSQYRLAVAWQNTSYNQPPHPSYFIGEGMGLPATPRLEYTTPAETPEVVPARGNPTAGIAALRVTGGARDGDYTVRLQLVGRGDAELVRILEDGAVVAELTDPPRRIEWDVTGKPAGTYGYEAEVIVDGLLWRTSVSTARVGE